MVGTRKGVRTYGRMSEDEEEDEAQPQTPLLEEAQPPVPAEAQPPVEPEAQPPNNAEAQPPTEMEAQPGLIPEPQLQNPPRRGEALSAGFRWNPGRKHTPIYVSPPNSTRRGPHGMRLEAPPLPRNIRGHRRCAPKAHGLGVMGRSPLP